MPSPIDLTPYWCRHRGANKDLRQAQEVSTDAYQSFPALFMLNEQASFSHRRVELRVAVNSDGMVQRILQIDVHASRFSVLSFPDRKVLDSFEISHLVRADYPGDLVIRLGFRQSVPGWFAMTSQNKEKKEQIWTRVFHAMSASQRDYVGALLQGLVGLNRPLNPGRELLCANKMLHVGREQLTVWTGSWNMGNKPAPDFTPSKRGVAPSVRPWLILDEKEFDLYVAGVQEMDAGVFALIDQQLGPDYYQVAKTSMGVIALTVYVRKRLLPHVKNVETVTSAAGFAGVGTNKGFVAAAMTIYEQPLLFIGCHLAARDDAGRLKQRIHQYKLASRRIKLGRLPGTDPFHQFTSFFLGDMNFRVCTTDRNAWPQAGRTRKEVVDGLYDTDHAKAVAKALEGDQLMIEKEKGAIFDGFKEGQITFSPTYKYEPFPGKANWESVKNSSGVVVGHQVRDTPPTTFSTMHAEEDLGVQESGQKVSGYYLSARENGQRREYTTQKLQVPSWCDRILYRALPQMRIDQTAYKCVDDIVTSDHSPVYGTFILDVPQSSVSVPSAAFHVAAIQILRIEVYNFRHPAMAVHDFFDEKNGMTAEEEDCDEDDDEDIPATPAVQFTNPPEPSNRLLAERKESDASELDIYSVKGETTSQDGRPHLNQMACAAVMPFMREAATRSRVTSKITSALTESHMWKPNCKVEPTDKPEFLFTGKDLQGMAVGPFLTTREHLQSQWFVLHLLPRPTSETRESAAACVVSLTEAADGRTVNFEARLQHNGQPSGIIRGKFRVWLDADGWDEEFVQNPQSHRLNPKHLTKNFNLSSRPASRRKSPAPPGYLNFVLGEEKITYKTSLPKLVVAQGDDSSSSTVLSTGVDDEILQHIRLVPTLIGSDTGGGVMGDASGMDDDDDPQVRLAKQNTLLNASSEVTGFRRFEQRVKRSKKKPEKPMETAPHAVDLEKKKKKGFLGNSTRRMSTFAQQLTSPILGTSGMLGAGGVAHPHNAANMLDPDEA